MNFIIRFVVISLLLSALASAGPSDNTASSSAAKPAEFSVDDFDWRDMVPYLYVAAGLPAEQAIKELLENSKVLRAYVANDIRAECGHGTHVCSPESGSFMVQGKVSKKIDEIVQEGMFRRHKITRVDYVLDRQPFPFAAIAALKTDKHRDAYLVLDFADNSYTAAQVQHKYGAPYDTNVVEWYSLYMYKVDTKTYTARTAFKIDPINGEVIRVAISLRRKDLHK